MRKPQIGKKDLIYSQCIDSNLGIELLHATYTTHQFAPHFHKGYAIGVIEKGEYSYLYRGNTEYISQGQIVVINPYEIHTGRAVRETGWTYRMFYPSISFMENLSSEIERKPSPAPFFEETIINDSQTAALFITAHASLGDQEKFTYETLLREAFSMLITRYGKKYPPQQEFLSRKTRYIDTAIDFMHEYYHQKITLSKVANLCELSPYYFIRLFTKEKGVLPHIYLMNLRVNYALDMVRKGYTLSESALLAGFADQSHMNRWFKRILGYTPGVYKKGLYT